MAAGERAPRAQKEESAEITITQRTGYKRLFAIGAGVMGALAAFETLSNLPETLAKDKNFFSIVNDLFLYLLFEFALPIAIVVSVLTFIHVLLLACFYILTSGHRKRQLLTKAQKWVMPIPSCVVLVALVYLAVISNGHPFDEVLYRISNWDQNRRTEERERERHKEISDCMAASHSEKEEYNCQFDVPP